MLREFKKQKNTPHSTHSSKVMDAKVAAAAEQKQSNFTSCATLPRPTHLRGTNWCGSVVHWVARPRRSSSACCGVGHHTLIHPHLNEHLDQHLQQYFYYHYFSPDFTISALMEAGQGQNKVKEMQKET